MSAQELFDEILRSYGALPAAEKKTLEQAAVDATRDLYWVPNPGPQTAAYFCEADELLYGGAAGGGKSDLLLGVALNLHQRSRILRRINQDAVELGDRLIEIVGSDKGYKSHPPTWKGPGRKDVHGRLAQQQIELRGCEQERDKQRYKGRARDFIGYDELTDFLESQYVFINTWNRSVDPNQRCRIVGATNGPTTAEGQWVVTRWGAWLDPKHPRPAKDGELRWYLNVKGQDTEVDGPGPHEVDGRGLVRATSRTFIRSRLSDNPDLARTDYGQRLESLPEELRAVYVDGNFTLGLRDHEHQVIPTAWIEAAQARWSPARPVELCMSAIAVDVAPGGRDQLVLAARYGGWYAPLIAKREVDKDGSVVAGLVVQHRRDACPVVVDLGGGWGGDALVRLKDNGVDAVPFNGVQATAAKTRDGKLTFYNKRAESIWRMREELDPEQEGGSPIALPGDPELKADLASYHWELTSRGIKVEDKEEIKKRIGRSPDKGDAATMCLSEGNAAIKRRLRGNAAATLKVELGYAHLKGRRRR